MIAQKNRTGYTTPAPEKDGVWAWPPAFHGAYRRQCGFFVRNVSAYGRSVRDTFGCARSVNRVGQPVHSCPPSWPRATGLKTYSRRLIMSNVSLCASAPVEFQFQSNTVRTVAIDGEVWFCATDVCKVLGYTNAPDAVSKHCKSGGIAKRDTPTVSGIQQMLFINESNLYRLIIRSKKPEAEKFETWVMEEVLPAIRKTGAYIHAPAMRPALTTAQKRALKQKIWQMAPNWITQSGEQWIYNHLRVAFQVARFDDIPSDCFDAAMALLESKQKAISQYIELFYEMRTWFEREVLGASTPWTPHIRKLFFAKLGRQVILPPKVDWLALADEMKARKGGLK